MPKWINIILYKFDKYHSPSRSIINHSAPMNSDKSIEDRLHFHLPFIDAWYARFRQMCWPYTVNRWIFQIVHKDGPVFGSDIVFSWYEYYFFLKIFIPSRWRKWSEHGKKRWMVFCSTRVLVPREEDNPCPVPGPVWKISVQRRSSSAMVIKDSAIITWTRSVSGWPLSRIDNSSKRLSNRPWKQAISDPK